MLRQDREWLDALKGFDASFKITRKDLHFASRVFFITSIILLAVLVVFLLGVMYGIEHQAQRQPKLQDTNFYHFLAYYKQ